MEQPVLSDYQQLPFFRPFFERMARIDAAGPADFLEVQGILRLALLEYPYRVTVEGTVVNPDPSVFLTLCFEEDYLRRVPNDVILGQPGHAYLRGLESRLSAAAPPTYAPPTATDIQIPEGSPLQALFQPRFSKKALLLLFALHVERWELEDLLDGDKGYVMVHFVQSDKGEGIRHRFTVAELKAAHATLQGGS